jgi:hypothetical protein
MPPTRALSDVMRVLKTNSSRWVHEQWPEKNAFAWQAGYGAFSVSKSSAEEVRHYIENQEEHHKHVSFQDEFRAFLSPRDHVRRAVHLGVEQLSQRSYAPTLRG